MLELEFFQLSHPGLQRDRNEDRLGYFQPAANEDAGKQGWLFALADGVGGHERGDLASNTAIEALISGFEGLHPGESLTTALPRLIQTANAKVFETATNFGGSDMATTIVACALRHDRAIVAHAGDSRCYLVRQGCAQALTRDHTLPNEQLRLGLLSSAEAAAARSSHILSRALGTNMFLNVDSSEHQLFEGDLMLLCSDGLHQSVRADDIVRLTAAANPLSSAARDLVELANRRDGSDNISVQLIRILDVERVGMYRGRHYRLP